MIAVMIAAATAMFFSLLGTRFLIRYFRRRGAGQPILGKEDHGPEHHMSKQGTPTMGGLAIVGSAGIGWVVAHLRPGIAFATQSLIMWVGVLVLAGMGLLDDVIKVRKRHNRGIFWKKKSYITLGLSVLLAWWLVAATGVSETISFTRANWPGWHVPWPIFVVFAGVMIWSTSNAVNVTDGLDGSLARGLNARTELGAYLDAIALEMRRDPRVFLIGQDIGPFGGSMQGTRGLFDEFGNLIGVTTQRSMNAVIAVEEFYQ
mgnify:CR=1 FL=1